MSVQEKRKTNLQKLKELAKALLFMEPQTTEFAPMVIKHPFTDSGIVGLRNEAGELRIGNIMESEADLQQWRKVMGDVIDKTESAFGIYLLVTKSYALGFAKYAEQFLSKEDFTRILADAWIRCENPNNDPNLSRNKILSLFKAADPAVLMDSEELSQLQALEDTVTVYRGVRSNMPGSVKALSWTLSRDTAEWFANRYGKSGTVYEAKIDKDHIHALFLGRNESEVIVDPKYLCGITQVQELAHGGMKMEEL